MYPAYIELRKLFLKSIYKNAIIYILIFIIACTPKNQNHNLLALLDMIPNLGDYWAQIYWVNFLIVLDPNHTDFIEPATQTRIDKNKNKIILISGWNYNDKSNRNYPSSEELKKRVLNNWKHLFSTSQFIELSNNLDVFVFDYLTSDPIDKNGWRLRLLLDQFFTEENKTVIIYAHSMGGLVSRFALYYKDSPSYIKKIITAGTPFHGSPWASPEYQKDKSLLGELAQFLTNTEGGKDLRWDNYDNSLPNSSNQKLTQINQNFDRDSYLITLYGEVPSGTSFESDSLQTFGIFCTLLNDFNNHDCVVPSRSAYLDNHSVYKNLKIGKYDHTDVNWGTTNTRNFILNIILNL
ncbi:MAG: lipase/acyltransferase domain-containing protein [Leptonema sp. (in: bacteria)]